MKMLLLMICVALCSLGPLQADMVTYTVTPSGSDYLYEFTLKNEGSTGGTLFDLFLLLPTDISTLNTAAIGTPIGWGDATGGLLFFGLDSPGNSFVQWAADFSMLYDLGIGSSLWGFSVLSSTTIPSPIQFSLNGSLTFETAQAAAVPEPGSIVLLVSALVGIGVAGRKKLLRSRW